MLVAVLSDHIRTLAHCERLLKNQKHTTTAAEERINRRLTTDILIDDKSDESQLFY